MSTSLNILLVEDEFMTRRMLKTKLRELGYVVVGETDNVDEAVSILDSTPVDLAVLDINLGDEQKDGIWLGEYIRFHHQIPFVYLTAYETSDIVDRALNTEPHAYLTKPFNELSLRTSLAIAAQQHTQSQPTEAALPHLLIKHNELLMQLPLQDICYFESDGNYLQVNTEAEQYRYRGTIRSIIKNLPKEQFLQTHRAFIVNRSFITGFNRTVVSVAGSEIPIAKSKAAEVSNAMKTV